MLHVDTVFDVFLLLMLRFGVAELGHDALGLAERGKEIRYGVLVPTLEPLSRQNTEYVEEYTIRRTVPSRFRSPIRRSSPPPGDLLLRVLTQSPTLLCICLRVCIPQ